MTWQPERGDLAFLSFSPQAGTEQGGRRPGLVLSERSFNVATGLVFICPVTTQLKGSHFEVPLPAGPRLSGAILCDHLRSLDWISRSGEFHGRVDDRTLAEVLARVRAIMSL
jgi:mRNA interferase MazF